LKNVAIFGATSAIAEQVARLYAAEGARLFLAARSKERVDEIARDLTARGAAATVPFAIDFDDLSRFAAMIEVCQREIGQLDVVLIAYGTLGDQKSAEADPAVTARELHTNFVSPATLLNILALHVRPGGALGAITSVAGDRGRQSNYVYGAAKGGLSRFLEGMRHRLAPAGVRVVDIRPGFVDTPMTAHIRKGGPLWARAENVARDIRRALDKQGGTLYTPWYWAHVMRLVRNVPAPIFHKSKL
jgi:short-subunit dehydrogenase